MEDTITGGTYTENKFTEMKEIKDDFSKRVEKYLRLSHQTLAEMLALRDEEENKLNPNDGGLQPNQPYYPYVPYVPYVPPLNMKWCPVSMCECTNPFGDCINCPYHGSVTYDTTCTNTTAELKTNVNSSNSDFIEQLKKDKMV